MTKESWYRDYDGQLTPLAIMMWMWVFIASIILIMVGGWAISANYEVRAFNRFHSTDYTYGEWFWASQTIKDYHIGPVENKNLNIDLNIEDLRNDRT